MEPKEFSEEIDLHKYWLVLKRRWLPATGVFSLVVALAALAAYRTEPTYEAKGRLRLEVDRTTALAGLETDFGELQTLSSKNSPLDTEAEVIRSLPIAQTTVQQLDLRNNDGELMKPETLVGRLTVKPVTGTDILQISLKDSDPELAATIVNHILKVYIRQNVRDNRQEATAAREFIEKQLPQSESAVRQAEADLQQFRERNRVIALSEEASQAVSLIGDLDDAITQAQSQLADVSARVSTLQQQVGYNTAQALDVSALSQASGVQDALKSLQEAQAELEVQSTRYRSTHPTVATLQRRVNVLQNLLQTRINEVLARSQSVAAGDLQIGEVKQELITTYVRTEVERLGLAQRIQLLSEAQRLYQQRASTFPALERTQRELERRIKAAQTTYETLLTQLQQVRVAENQNVGNARVLTPAIVPGSPIAPNKKMYLAAGGVAGLLLAIVTAFLLDLIDRSIKTVREGKELFGYTLLGVIPTFGRSGKPGTSDWEASPPRVVMRDMPTSPIAEAYQMLQANLKFLSSDREYSTIVVTSSVPREGKSEVSANLAAAIAQVGRRVLLIDADMRNPSQHTTWDISNRVGLSNVIVGQTRFVDAVHPISRQLHVLPSGIIPPNPIALLDSKRMASLLESFSNTYDYIIIDTPPAAGCADALILGRMSDGVLLVMRPGVVDSSSAAATKGFLAQSGQNVLGLVANGVNIHSESDSYFHYTKEYATPVDSDLQRLPALDDSRL